MHIVASERFMENVLLSDVHLWQFMFVSSAWEHWVTLHSWVRHLKCSLCLLALPKESLGYTTLMGVPPKVQPMTCLLALPKESLGYTTLMGATPKVQPMFVSST